MGFKLITKWGYNDQYFMLDVLFLLLWSPLEHKASPQEVSTCLYPSLITVTLGKGKRSAIFKPVPVFTYIGI